MHRYTFFHKPEEENGFLSNWYKCRFIVDGVTYTSMEQYMMHKKALLFGDMCVAKRIMATEDVVAIKALGRKVCNFNESMWAIHREDIVFAGLYAKFTQNATLRDALIHTGNTTIAECAVKDKIWGIGMSMTNPDRFDQAKWPGENLLGCLLMCVREQVVS